ncbi:MAG: aminoacyl-tRNA hydrolase [Candidatus Kaelpia aquatica]|nr:aminoacyl-tRNA hydrolase [Candidatus Kaelpia aquatica]
MLLISGLGNPGLEYKDTLHNLGFMVLDELAARHGLKFRKNKCGAKIVIMAQPYCEEEKPKPSIFNNVLRFKKTGSQTRVVLAKPYMYMNLSGKSIACLKDKYGIKSNNIVIISDDLNLERGQIRIRAKGGSGGHKGLESIIDEIGTESFIRFRVGIGEASNGERAEEYLLSPIAKEEKSEYADIVANVVDAIEFYLKEGIEKTMSIYNFRNVI